MSSLKVKFLRKIWTILFSWKCISQFSSLENSYDNQSKHDGIKYNQWNRNIGERRCSLYLHLSMIFREAFGTPATCKIKLFVTIVIASSRWLFFTKSSTLNAAGVLEPRMLKARKLEQSTSMVGNRSHG